jgi:hypothetical protein
MKRRVDLDRVEEASDVQQIIEAPRLGRRVHDPRPIATLPTCRTDPDHSASRVDWAQLPIRAPKAKARFIEPMLLQKTDKLSLSKLG